MCKVAGVNQSIQKNWNKYTNIVIWIKWLPRTPENLNQWIHDTIFYNTVNVSLTSFWQREVECNRHIQYIHDKDIQNNRKAPFPKRYFPISSILLMTMQSFPLWRTDSLIWDSSFPSNLIIHSIIDFKILEVKSIS